jgi:hypothetical protein
LSNSRIYLKSSSKNSIENQDEIDFECIAIGKSHSLAYNINEDIIYLFRVDLYGNLFYSNLNLNNEKFISNNVEKVSCCYGNNKIYFSFISNRKCYTGEIINNSVFINQLNLINGDFINTYLYFKDKCYLIITKKDLSNYLLEESNNKFLNRDQLTASVSIDISTYEVI